ncbi:P-loop containing nucleoside triphosphate hydrolase [Pseudocohnilembus persalinus]|uniref:p-loop containing nucleoside triphosphate hydrolase n=1 Tax=Pseudocohnilembus persalinus TaxID=266149 RepID=A0A0V0QTG0_PSEPJ|nr:P-loop containing nucleoside triphosphate hydrolase [Pseudocohnilembus persalinus]|eukprot:KRX05689.1 P-loop containing nucleoside triphosphate hydrolase [Pseudocohnilembus persalinus]
MELLKLSEESLINELHRRYKCRSIKEQKNLVLIGAPGAGKGTHSYKLMQRFCLCQISTGDILRNEIRNQTDLGMEAKSIMEKGDLVPDHIVISMVNHALSRPECKNGAILDGFPRTLKQAQGFDSILSKNNQKIWRALYFDIDDEVVTERLAGRLVHPASGRSYHVKFNPPKSAGLDDITSEPLIQRNDDKEHIIRKRLNNFHEQTRPMLDYYASQGNLVRVNAHASIKNVWRQIKDAFTGEDAEYKMYPRLPDITQKKPSDL